jgi:hypothetical protein
LRAASCARLPNNLSLRVVRVLFDVQRQVQRADNRRLPDPWFGVLAERHAHVARNPFRQDRLAGTERFPRAASNAAEFDA